jgi:hypothetical protein
MEEEHIPLELERKPNAENLNEINEMHNEARKAFYNKEKEDEDIAKLQQSILEEKKNRATDLEIGKSNTTTFTPDKSSVKPYTIRTTVIAGLMSLFSILPHQSKAEGGDTKKDKEPVKKELHTTNAEYHEVSQDLKAEWGNYHKWVVSEIGQDAVSKVTGKTEADRLLRLYIKNHPETILNDESVLLVQKAFIGYRQWVLDRVKNYTAIIDGVTKDKFMDDLSKEDNIAGYRTLRDFPTEYTRYVEEMRMKMPITAGKTVDYVVAHNEHLKKNGYSNME